MGSLLMVLLLASVVVHIAMVMGVAMETGMAETLFLEIFLFVKAMQHLEELSDEWLCVIPAGLQQLLEFLHSFFVTLQNQ